MRIAIYHNLPSGGAKRALHDFVSGSKGCHDFDLYRINDPRNEEFLDLRPLVKRSYEFDYQALHLPRFVKGVRAVIPIINLRRLLSLQLTIAEQIDRQHYDLVFVHHCRITQSPAIIPYLQTPVLYFMQEPRRVSFEQSLKTQFPRIRGPLSLLRAVQQRTLEQRIQSIDSASARAADLILCNSYYSLESIERAYGCDPRVAYLGIDADRFGLSIAKREAKVLSVGAIHPSKGHDFTIRSLATLPPEKRPSLDIVYDRGVPEHEDALRSMANRVGVQLRLHRRVSDGQLVQLYQGASATLCAARLEPFGFTPLESMSCGTPVVAVREGGYRETVIDGVNGWLTDREEAVFGQAIQRVLQGGDVVFDPRALHRYVQENWSTDRSIARLETFCRHVAKP